MAKPFACTALLCALALNGCAGGIGAGMGTATITDGGVDVQGAGVGAGIGPDGPRAGAASASSHLCLNDQSRPIRCP